MPRLFIEILRFTHLFVCFVVINPFVLSANRVDLGFCLFHKFSSFTPPPGLRTPQPVEKNRRHSASSIASSQVVVQTLGRWGTYKGGAFFKKIIIKEFVFFCEVRRKVRLFFVIYENKVTEMYNFIWEEILTISSLREREKKMPRSYLRNRIEWQ